MGDVGETHALQSPNAAMSRSALVEERKHFLARAFGVFIALLGLAMLGVLVGNVLGNGTTGVQNVSWAQILQGCLGALFVALVIRGDVARAVLGLANKIIAFKKGRFPRESEENQVRLVCAFGL